MFVQLFADARAGVVVENIHVTKAVDGSLDHAIQVFLLGDIDMGKNSLPTFFVFDQLVDARRDSFLNIAAQYFGALSPKQARSRSTDAAVGAGDDRHFTF